MDPVMAIAVIFGGICGIMVVSAVSGLITSIYQTKKKEIELGYKIKEMELKLELQKQELEIEKEKTKRERLKKKWGVIWN